MSGSMIELEHVKKKYPDFSMDITMEVRPGAITGLIGRNGAGKSTAFKMILGVVQPDSGQISLFGKDMSEITCRDKEQIGVALAESGFSSYFTIQDIAPVLKAMYPSFDKQAFLDGCAAEKLPFKKHLKDFSTGMKAKLKVLAAISHQPKLLILDEPTAGLDVTARNELLDMLRHYMEGDEERSILISSHISSDLEGLCDDIYMIDNGHILLHEETDVVLDRYGILKLSESQYEKIDKTYIQYVLKESFGYTCLTGEKQYYAENYPDIVIEKNSIDELIVLMTGGKKI